MCQRRAQLCGRVTSTPAVERILPPPYWRPRPWQQEVLEATDQYLRMCIVLARRLGKTSLLWNILIMRAWQRPGLHLYIAPTYSQAKQIIWGTGSITSGGPSSTTSTRRYSGD
jgi:hypothetical protein